MRDEILNYLFVETGLAAALLEPSLNEGVMRSEDSNKEESKYVVIDIVQESEEEVDPLIRCCSCFSFFIPLGTIYFILFPDTVGLYVMCFSSELKLGLKESFKKVSILLLRENYSTR